MPRLGGWQDTRLRVDMAALHPALQPDATGMYFRDGARLRDAIKAALGDAMAIEHDLFLTANATAGLMVAMAGLAIDGIALNLEGARYPGYAPLLGGNADRRGAGTATFVTHVDPLSGHVRDVAGVDGLCVLDASQSFGTICRHADAFRADIVISGLQKHAGVAAGLGLLAIRKGADCAGVRRAAAVAEQGTVALSVLEGALRRCSGPRAQLFNRLVLNVPDDLADHLAARRMRVLTPAGANLPFICLTGEIPENIGARCAEAGFSAKLFSHEGIVRLSGYAPGRGDSPVLDRSNLMADLLLSLIEESNRDVG